MSYTYRCFISVPFFIEQIRANPTQGRATDLGAVRGLSFCLGVSFRFHFYQTFRGTHNQKPVQRIPHILRSTPRPCKGGGELPFRKVMPRCFISVTFRKYILRHTTPKNGSKDPLSLTPNTAHSSSSFIMPRCFVSVLFFEKSAYPPPHPA